VLAFVRREQNPRVTCLVMGACVLSIMMSLFMTVLLRTTFNFMPFDLMRHGVLFINSCLGSVPYALLLWAAFMDRRKDGL
jgi:hypothetical protein